EDLEIEWLSPYLQTGSKDAEPIIGRKIQDVFDGILEAMEEDDPENKIINWRDNYYRIRVEKDIHVINLENVSYYIHIREELERNKHLTVFIFLNKVYEISKR